MNALRVPSPVPAAAKAATTNDGFTALDACHRETLAMLDELSALVAKVESEGADAASRASAAKIASYFAIVPRQHHEDEERHVFPPLATGGDPETVQAVLRLQQDHDWLEEDWFELAPHVQAIATGILSCDIDVLREGVAVLSALYRDHMELEESLLYPQARAQMPAAQRREMGREMAARRRAGRPARRARGG